jgi:hypothetical protein
MASLGSPKRANVLLFGAAFSLKGANVSLRRGDVSPFAQLSFKKNNLM